MKKVIVISCVLALALVPGFVGAQGLFAGMGNFFSYEGAACDPGQGKDIGKFYAGYTWLGKGVSFNLGMDPPVTGVSTDGTIWRLSAISLGASYARRVNPNLGVTVSGWWAVPVSQEQAIETFEGGFVGAVLWDASTYWWWVDGLASYRVTGAMDLLAGFRYDVFQATLSDPEVIFNANNNPTDEVTLHVNSYLPLVGVRYHGPYGMSVSAVGFPIVPGDLTYGLNFAFGPGGGRWETSGPLKKGYFLEVMAEYRATVMDTINIGGFLRYSATRAEFNGTLNAITGAGAAFAPGSLDGALTRNAWTVGATASMEFNIPSLNL